MAFFGFGKKQADGSGGGDTAVTPYSPDRRKAERFYEHAHKAVETRRHDYAIELFISGLRFDPVNMDIHEQVLENAKRWKVSGEKSSKPKPASDAPLDRALHAEQVWALDFTDPRTAYRAMELFVEADGDPRYADTALGDVALWLGQFAMDYNQSPNLKAADKKLFLLTRDRFKDIGVFDRALEAHSRAIRLDPSDMKLHDELKELEALKYTQDRKEAEGGAMGNIKDADAQELLQAEGRSANQGAVDRVLAARREAYEADPDDTDNLNKLVEALLRSEEEERENEAIGLLQKAFGETKTYRFKSRAGDIRIKQFGRQLRDARAAAKKNPNDKAARARHDALQRERLLFELGEYGERVEHYPTDLRLKFEYGRRLLQNGDHDDAIAMLQQATGDPKSRSAASLLLGKAFNAKGWHDEAIDTVNRGFEEHEIKDDAVGKELRYERMNSLLGKGEREKNAEALREAQADASSLLRVDINFKDIRAKMERIKALLAELQSTA